MQVPSAVWFAFPAGRCTCSHGKVGSRLDCSEFTDKDEWPPNSPDDNPLDYLARGVLLKNWNTFQPKPK